MENPLNPSKAPRPVFTFPVPEHLRSEVVKESVSLFKLDSGDELEATKACQGDSMRLAWELTKQALAKVDGEPVNRHDGSVEVKWNGFDPKLRALCLAAYGKLHTPGDSEEANFLEGMTTEVG